MFPESSQHIHAQWSALQRAGAEESEQWTEFSRWAEQNLGERFRELKDELLGGHEGADILGS
ncbi:hypothetical protein [Pseudomonas poae]|uniref:hypothetical protein n=1 Tax=Pseudomonas poae TaxID=200451 RepID=UPI003BAF869D